MFSTVVTLLVGAILIFGSSWLLKIQKPRSGQAHQDQDQDQDRRD